MSLVTEGVFCWVYGGGEKLSGASADDGAGSITAGSDVVVGEATSSVLVLPAPDLFDEVPGSGAGWQSSGVCTCWVDANPACAGFWHPEGEEGFCLFFSGIVIIAGGLAAGCVDASAGVVVTGTAATVVPIGEMGPSDLLTTTACRDPFSGGFGSRGDAMITFFSGLPSTLDAVGMARLTKLCPLVGSDLSAAEVWVSLGSDGLVDDCSVPSSFIS